MVFSNLWYCFLFYFVLFFLCVVKHGRQAFLSAAQHFDLNKGYYVRSLHFTWKNNLS
jgi:hypothetical protein